MKNEDDEILMSISFDIDRPGRRIYIYLRLLYNTSPIRAICSLSAEYLNSTTQHRRLYIRNILVKPTDSSNRKTHTNYGHFQGYEMDGSSNMPFWKTQKYPLPERTVFSGLVLLASRLSDHGVNDVTGRPGTPQLVQQT